MLATGENVWAMRVFEVIGNFVFVCFANGKMSVYDAESHNLVRQPIAAHSEEIKHITRGKGNTLITSCLDNQVGLARPSANCRPRLPACPVKQTVESAGSN